MGFLDALTLAQAGPALENGYLQGNLGAAQRDFQRSMAVAQLQALNAYHQGMVANGQGRNAIQSGRYFGVGADGSPILDGSGSPIQGQLAQGQEKIDNTQSYDTGRLGQGQQRIDTGNSRVDVNALLGLLRNAGAASANPNVAGAVGQIAGQPAQSAQAITASPLEQARAAQAQAGAGQRAGKTQADFVNTVGNLPAAQQPGFVQNWNQAAGSRFAVPGSNVFPTTPGGAPAQGPPAVAQAYSPTLTQAAGAAQKQALAGKTAFVSVAGFPTWPEPARRVVRPAPLIPIIPGLTPGTSVRPFAPGQAGGAATGARVPAASLGKLPKMKPVVHSYMP